MKRILSTTLQLAAFCLLALQSAAQSRTYGNEWIDYNKTYYKFKVGKPGVFRISRATLDAAGLPASVSAGNFILYRDGHEVPVFVSASGSYLEFLGRPADGVLDRELYEDPAWQPDSRISLFTDTACYFLTYDNSTNHLRFSNAPNTIPATPPTPEVYNWATVGNYYKNVIIEGQSHDTTYNPNGNSANPGLGFYSPSFDNGEGFVNALVNNGTSNIALATPNVAPVSLNATLRTAVATRSFHQQHLLNLSVNNNLAASAAWGTAQTKHITASVPATQLAASNTMTYAMTITAGTPTSAYDVYGVSYVELEYPRNFDVNGLVMHTFRLAPNASTRQYLEFTNFSGASPRLYDTTNRIYYEGDILNGKVRFYLQPSAVDRQFALVSSANPTATLGINKKFQFTNYTAAANEGDYIILTHKQLMVPAGGSNDIIQEYKDYRSSINGGNRKVQVADVTELYDQFGYGYDLHPQSIRNFLEYAYNSWTLKPVAVNIIGHGLQYDNYATYFAHPSVYTFPVVPVYGHPGSDVDFVNFGTPRTQKIQIGRVSVWNANEVSTYLTKVKDYETALRTGNTASSLWKKRVMHLAGGTSANELSGFLATLNYAASIIRDTLMGAEVNTFGKGSSNAIQPITIQQVNNLLTSGQSMISYLGHASPDKFEFSLPNPGSYNAGPRVPIFVAMGCDIAQMFTVASVPAITKTLSEGYTLAPNGGAIAMLATDNYGYTGFLDNYLFEYYYTTGFRDYGATVGLHTLKANNAAVNAYSARQDWRFYFTHIESQILTGDPGVATYGPPKPDYHVSNDAISSIPSNVSIATDSFQLRITAYNLGAAKRDTVSVKVQHITPGGLNSDVRIQRIANLFNTDTIYVWMPVNKITDLGLNRYHVSIDPSNQFDEMDETNNEADFTQFIYSDNVVPVYPHEFAIVHKQGVTLKASTLNPFRSSARYFMEIDTTTAFNSPQKLQTTITSLGGLIKWTPSLVMKDSTVYYWRTAIDSANGAQQWAQSSFVYLANGSDGWNQSHYFQYRRDNYDDSLDLKADRMFKYNSTSSIQYEFFDGVVFNDGGIDKVVRNSLDVIQRRTQSHDGLFVMVIDSSTATPWVNSAADARGSYPPFPNAPYSLGTYVREYDVSYPGARIAARNYIESIPDGHYVMIKSVIWDAVTPTYIDAWKADTAQAGMGSGKSLYHTIYNMGFTKIDSFQRKSLYLFMKKKGAATNMTEQWTANLSDTLYYSTFIDGFGTSGKATSTVIGPASKWTDLRWKVHASDTAAGNDSSYVAVYGVDNANTRTLLFNTNARDTVLSGIPANTYPRLALVWHTLDSITRSAPQLDYWRVLYNPIPEAALNPSAHYVFSDSLQTGQMQQFSVAIENLTDLDFRDSMLVRYKVINANGVSSLLSNVRYKKLLASDTIHATLNFDPAAYPGNNNLFIEANPDNDQPEQYHPNNLGYLPFTIGVDKNNPLLDVTFDGVHILNRDIVSSKPFIKISLKDDNQFLALDDTSLVSIQLKGQQHSVINLPFNGTTCKFIPGQTGANNKNTAVIELRPDLEDDIYSLEITGKDKSSNHAGTPQGSTSTGAKYTVEFEVVNKATVTNVLNYPNPFSTATSFIFTITGSQIPSQFKIQILSVTGKVVREITKNELGPLHIGRNITEYKWDGRDQYGQMLGNGVYMYRVATSLNGEQIEHRNSGGDRFFKNGYGKMYIMR